MRKLVYAINLSIDGCCDHTKMIGDEAILEYFADLLRDAGLLIYGRITYELMVPYWPDVAKNPTEVKAANEFARTFDSIKRVVFSRSLGSADENTRIVRSGLQEEILGLKQEEGKNMFAGGVALPTQLIELGLIDEYYFVVQPLIVGEGRRLFEGVNLPERLKLKLVDTKILKSGQVALHYVKQ
jgi:dihydrofolate reductase